jgi:S1-C subfamily serine protease
VVKISVTLRNPDFSHPWNKANPTEASGTGFLIEGNRIVTNAHVVRYASQVYVQPDQSDEKYEANIEAISYGLDLAVLSLESPDAIGDRMPLVIDNTITPLRSEVNVYGFPIGGNQISITKGIVSRIEYTGIGSNQLGLRAQIDAAINPGNSGGPAISNGKVVGVAFSGMQNASNIGYLIHATELVAFLKDVEDGKCDGKANIWDYFQTTENPALRTRLKLPKNAGGVMVSGLRESKDHVLKIDDVVIKIGPFPIDSQGNVKVNELTLSFVYYCPILVQDEHVPLTVWRDGQEIELMCPCKNSIRSVIPYLNGEYPRYFIYGPLAFEAACGELVISLLSDNRASMMLGMRRSPLVSSFLTLPDENLQELVIVPSPPFSHRSTKGYRPPVMSVVASVNRIKIRSLKHLVEVFRDCSDEFIEIEFAEAGAEKLVFNRKEIATATESILTDNNIRKQFSEDLEDTWNNGKPK